MRVVAVLSAAGAAAGLALAMAAGAQTNPQTPPQTSAPARSSRPQTACLDPHRIESFNVADESTVYIRVNVNEIYRLKLLGACPNLDVDQSITLQNRSGGFLICDPRDAELLVRGPGVGLQRCFVSEMHKLTPAELAALPKKNRP